MPRRLPTPIPELAYLVRMAIELAPLPASRLRDHVVNYLRHVSILRRLPAKHWMFNDALYRFKTGPVAHSAIARLVSDKEQVKRHIAQAVGEKYNIPTLAILSTLKEVDQYDFPESCVIKPTHASATSIARKKGEPLDYKLIKSWLKLDFYAKSFEPNYRGLTPKIIVEPWVFNRIETTEFKIFCVGGKPKTINAIADRYGHYCVATFDPEWNELNFKVHVGANHKTFEKPAHLSEILSIAERLSQDFFFTRIDFYYDGTTIRCGEITNCSAAGLENYIPRDAELVHSRLLFADVSEADSRKFFYA